MGQYLAPFYTQDDITGDGQVTTVDLDKLDKSIGMNKHSRGWSSVKNEDFDGDGAITVADLATLAQRMIYDDGDFNLIEASVLDMQKALNAGVITSVQLTQMYLDRIAAYNKTVQPGATQPLNAVITTAPDALAEAAASDAARKRNGGAPRDMLDGIPIILKDNYDTKDMPTTAGCSCWTLNQTTDDATMVKGLRASDAVIIGKASMDEFAINTSSQYSTGSPAGSDLNVYSPYNANGPSSTSGGSSGGTGASVSANLVALGFGTDTGGSIRVPSSYNQLVGLRPTVGLTSRSGIIPLALSQDSGGPIAKTVSDVAIALDSVVGTDPADTATANTNKNLPKTSYTAFLNPTGLQGQRIGYDPAMIGTNPAVVRLFNQTIADMQAQGATVVPVTIPNLSSILGEPSGSTNEFNHDLNTYITQHLNPAVPYRSLTDIANDGGFYDPGRGAPSGTYATRGAVTTDTYNTWIASHTANIATYAATVTDLMNTDSLAAMMYPTAAPYSSVGSNLRLSPNTSLPALTIPMGQAAGTETDAGFGGANVELLGRAYAEPTLISLGYSYEQATEHRTTPPLYPALSGDVVTGPGADSDPAGDGTVTLTKSASSVAVGDTFTVTLSQSAADLYAYDTELSYDPGDLQLVSTKTGTVGKDYITHGSGTVSVTHTQLGSSPDSEGDTALVTLTFKALHAGKSSVKLSGLTTVDGKDAATTVATKGTSLAFSVAPAATSISATAKVSSIKHSSADLVTLSVSVNAPNGVAVGGYVEAVIDGRPTLPSLVRSGKAELSATVFGSGTKNAVVTFVPATKDLAPSTTTVHVKLS